MGLNRDRYEAIWLLRRGEYGYAGHVLTKVVQHLPMEYREQIAGYFGQCDYTRVADMIEYQWPNV